jgi:hypothetical protein
MNTGDRSLPHHAQPGFGGLPVSVLINIERVDECRLRSIAIVLHDEAASSLGVAEHLPNTFQKKCARTVRKTAYHQTGHFRLSYCRDCHLMSCVACWSGVRGGSQPKIGGSSPYYRTNPQCPACETGLSSAGSTGMSMYEGREGGAPSRRNIPSTWMCTTGRLCVEIRIVSHRLPMFAHRFTRPAIDSLSPIIELCPPFARERDILRIVRGSS